MVGVLGISVWILCFSVNVIVCLVLWSNLCVITSVRFFGVQCLGARNRVLDVWSVYISVRNVRC